MTTTKLLEIIATYEQVFKDWKIPQQNFPHDQLPTNRQNSLAHCHAMLQKMREFVASGDVDKAFRWLGFIQGVLWNEQIFDLATLREHSRA